MITSLSELCFRFRRFILLLQTKKYCSSWTSTWKPWIWVRLDLIFTMRDICINSNLKPFTKFNTSSRSIEFKDIFPWNISQMITETVLISMRIVVGWLWDKLWDETGHPVLSLTESQWKLRQDHDQNISMERKPL